MNKKIIDLTKTSKIFCPYPFYHVCNTARGHFKLCCESDRVKKDDKFIHQSDVSIDDWWVSDALNEIRSNMVNNIETPACESCYVRERNGLDSNRIAQLNRIKRNHKNTDQIIKNIENYFNYSKYNPFSFDIKFGNLCNLRCRMCNPGASSNFAKELLKNKKELQEFNNVSNKNYEVQYTWWSDLEKYAKTMTSFKTTGGEPFFINDMHVFLNHLIDIKRNKDIDLKIITNGTFFNKELVCKLEEYFSHMTLQISIDGIDNTYDYIRYPAKWNNVSKNLNNFKLTSLKPTISITIQILNIFYIVDIFKYFDDNGFIWHSHELWDPACYQIEILPKNISNLILEKIQQYKLNRNLTDRQKISINKLTQQLDNSKENSELLNMFLRKTKKYDQIRKQNFSEMFPEFYLQLKANGYDYNKI